MNIPTIYKVIKTFKKFLIATNCSPIKLQQLLSTTRDTETDEEARKCTLRTQPELSQGSATAPKKATL